MKKKIVILTVILLILLSFLGLFFSYAYFSALIYNSQVAIVNTTLPNGSYTFTTSNAGSINLSFSANKMLSSAVSSTAISSGNTNIEVSLTSPDSNSRVICTYDLVWEWTSSDQYTTSDVALPYSTSYKYEMSVSVNSTTSRSRIYDLDTYRYIDVYGYDNNLTETDLSNFTWSNSKATILTGASIISDSATQPTVTKLNIKQNIYNLPVEQPKLQNKNFKSKVYVSNVNCDILPYRTNPVMVSGDINTSGSEVQIGTEYFYVLGEDESNSSNVKLLSKYNLLVGYIINATDNSYVEIPTSTEGYNMQSSTARGWVNGASQYVGTTRTKKPSTSVGNKISGLYEYVNKYKAILIGKYGLYYNNDSLIKAGLVSYDEANSIKSTSWGKLTSYWTGTINGTDVYGIDSNGIVKKGIQLFISQIKYGVRPVITIPKFIVVSENSSVNESYSPETNESFFVENPTILSGSLNTNGSEVQIGAEHFYVLGEDETNSSNVKLLTKYNLLVGNIYYPSNKTTVSIPNTTGYNLQSSSARGYIEGESQYIGVIDYSSTWYWNDNTTYEGTNSQYGNQPYNWTPRRYVYDSNSYLYQYVENYKGLLMNLVDVHDARLLTYIEAYNIVDTDWGELTSYWVGSAVDAIYINCMNSRIGFTSAAFDEVLHNGLRPVIIVSKSIFT